MSDRFSLYIAKRQAGGDDYANGAAVSGPRGQAIDPAVSRYRPYVVIAEDQATTASLQTRAKWEAITRAAKAQEAIYDDLGQVVQLKRDRITVSSPTKVRCWRRKST